jgi:hypothetical protein
MLGSLYRLILGLWAAFFNNWKQTLHGSICVFFFRLTVVTFLPQPIAFYLQVLGMVELQESPGAYFYFADLVPAFLGEVEPVFSQILAVYFSAEATISPGICVNAIIFNVLLVNCS